MSDNTKNLSPEEIGTIYAKHFDESLARKLLKKLRKSTMHKNKLVAGTIGKLVNILGHLLSAYENIFCPKPLKASIMGGIGYILLPFDLVADAIPVVGYSDDIAVATSVLILVKTYSTFSLEKLDKEIEQEDKIILNNSKNEQNDNVLLDNNTNFQIADLEKEYFINGVDLSQKASEFICGLMIYVASCDGLAEEEKIFIQSMLDFYHINKSITDFSTQEPDYGAIQIYLNPSDFIYLFRTCVAVTIVDNKISDKEKDVLEIIAKELNICNYEELINDVKMKLDYQNN